MTKQHYLFDWGDTLMVDLPAQTGPMCDWPKITVVPGAAECLRRLSLHAECHLATNARDSNVAQIRLALQRAGLSQYLNNIFCYRTVGYDKSEPAFYKHIADQLKVGAQHIIMVGDSLTKDIYPALAQGLNAIWYNPQRQIPPEQVESIHQLTELVS
ncbi:HAD family hydrolase [Paraglaciecola sp.]|uniref:HAD family hydrolase n=1 Tax=Paraglaciecola sp. TaxID=1920173 RepID=UPI0030F407BA